MSELWAEGRRERERGGGNTLGFGYNWKTTKHALHAPSGKTHRRRVASILPVKLVPPPLHRPGDRIRTRMELPTAGEHVFAVEGIEKKRIRKVTARGSVLCKNAPQTLKMLAPDTSLTIFPSTVTGQGRVPGQVARLVSQVSGNATFPGDFRMGGGQKREQKLKMVFVAHASVCVSVRARVCKKKKKVCVSVYPRMPSLIYAREGGRHRHVIPF